ncbi:MAG: hypothetical protein AAGF23_00790 [Acidobacteriota bacterium]
MTLPHGLADGLHVLEPSSVPWGLIAVAAVLAALGLRWWRSRRRPAPAAPAASTPSPSTPPPARSQPGIRGRVEALQARYRGDRRAGVHALAEEVRIVLTPKDDGAQPETLTALEISSRFSIPIGRLMQQIADLQWRRAEPKEKEFDRVFDHAADLLEVTWRPGP